MTESMLGRSSGLAAAMCSAVAVVLALVPASAFAEACPNAAYRTGPSAGLPDCRAYELVTPPFKEGAQAGLREQFPVSQFRRVAPDGSRMILTSLGNFGDAKAASYVNHYELVRSPSGWTEKNIDLPGTEFAFDELVQATPEVTETIFEAARGQSAIEVESKFGVPHELFLRAKDGTLRALGVTGEYEGASEGFTHVFYVTEGALREYSSPGTTPILVGAAVGGGSYDGISSSGSRVFFTGAAGVLYAQLDEAQTISLSEPSSSDCAACDTDPETRAGSTFNYATADGSQVFFETTQPLLGGDPSKNIYEYDFNNPAGPEDPDGRIVRVSAGNWGPAGAQVEATYHISEDGSHVYFVAKGALSEATNSQGQAPTEGADNLYVFERDARFPAGRTAFIATLASSDSTFWEYRKGAQGEASTTPDGRFFVFGSVADLTPDDTSTARQIFEYDAQTERLVRVSIGQEGFNDNGNTNIYNAEIPPTSQYGLGKNGSKGQYTGLLTVSDDGAYVVFQSAAGLTPQASDGLRESYTISNPEIPIVSYYVQNVYEYHDGVVYLISDGRDTASYQEESDVRLDGISASGSDIFFEESNQLTSEDLDTQIDVYDARLNGGFPAHTSLLPSCIADSCQGQLSPAPVLLAPGSEFQAGGNPPLATPPVAAKAKPKVKAKACKKGSKRKSGRCVKIKAKSSRPSARRRK
jgi:hypothetical protein